MNKILQKVLKLDAELQKRIKFDDSGYFDNTKIIGDTLFLERAVQHAMNQFAGKRITKIITAAVDGIPLATLLAHRLGVKLVIAKKEREVGIREFIEEVYIPVNTAVIMNLYVPRGVLKKGDWVLIVDDVIDTGEVQKTLIKIVERAKAEVTGIYAMVAFGNVWKKSLEQTVRIPIEVILQVSKKMNT
jgi:adenine phosphoribosyltransferase